MSKLNSVEKQTRKQLRKSFPNVRFVSCKDSGVTFVRCEHIGSNFDRVAVAYCGPSDTFNRKRGEYEALVKLASDQSILVHRGQVLAMSTASGISTYID